MDVIQEITDIVDRLNKVDEYIDGLSDKLSEIDGKEQDLLHYLEDNKINILWCYRYVKEMKKNRLDRRKIKNDMEISSKYIDNKNKLSSKENRQFILTELHKREKTLNLPYKNRQYTDEEIQKVLKGV